MKQSIYSPNKITIGGKRKTAVAKATIGEGSGKVTLNSIPYENLQVFHRLAIKEPIDIANQILGNFNFDISVKMAGGGQEGQIEAARLAIAKSLVKFTKSNELKKAYLGYDKALLVADTRRKEAYKPGDSKARANRQKSFR